ncbi:ubiquitin carboxyl-terminal hydrolase 18-like [Cornus florida]|uniref:ubiquitin carboxyl-terminal hydrolase 18-like n=1 Tax=Cornus florida TaxID=4283 RepID=UPI0028A05B34|nr:ubiquitin carboxyl-terminal hydrolase 18-like [Cornus florida]
MHVSGFPVDLNWFLQFIITALVIAFGLLHLVKNTLSKYFVVDANFESSDHQASLDSDLNMPGVIGTGDTCVVCGNLGTKKCSGCKLVRYCSKACQVSHWRSGHKTKCKDFQLLGKVNSMQSESMQHRRRGCAVALVPGSGTNKTLKQLKKILFPYKDFVEFFNWETAGFPPCGLLNCGNSCFANVVLQCLAHTRPLVAYLLEKGHRRECRRNDWCFLCEFQTHVERASKSQNPFSPINILSRLPNIGGNLGYGEQEDAHEFMRFAIDTMQSVCLDEFGGEKALHPSSQETTLIQHIFGGHLQSQVICTECNNISNQYENMMDLTVEIQGDAASLEECLDQFTVRERLHGDNMYKCDGCNDYVMAWKRLTIRRAPNILTIALKRFQSGRFGKLNKRVTFPETLDLRPYMSEAGDGNDIYKLYAVVVHVDMLNASFFGHYICYAKDFCGNWYRIDDCKVTSVELDEVLSQGAYMLLYSRFCARPSCLNPIEPSREKDHQIVKMAQELEPCPEHSVECFSTRDSNCRVGISASLPYDASSQENVSSCEEESSSVYDLKEDLDMVDCGSSPTVKKGTEFYGNQHSGAAEETASVGHAHRVVSGVVSSLTETHTPEAYFRSRESPSPDSGLEDEFGAENSRGNEFVSMNSSTQGSLPPQNGVCEKGEASHDASVAGLSSREIILDKTNLVNSKGKQEKVVSGKGLSSSGTIEDVVGKGTKLKPLFSPGFLGKRPRCNFTKKDAKVPLKIGELASACNLSSGNNASGEPGFPHQNGGKMKDVEKPLSNLNSSSSPSSFEEQDGKLLNEDEIVHGKSSESFDIGNGDSCAPDFSDKSMSNTVEDDHALVGNSD